jgi:outer membrane protein
MRHRSKLKGYALLLTGALALMFSAAHAGEQSGLKVGYVNLQKAITASQAGKKAAETLKKEREKLLEQIKEKEEELKEMQEQLSRQVSVLTEESLKEKQEEFRAKMKDYERFKNDSAEAWDRKKKELEEKIFTELLQVVNELGKDEQYTIIFAREQGIIYASEAIDLTDKAITRYDDKQK